MKLSVIIPVFNEAETIESIILKVLKQKNIFEIVVVDDGSTDKTKKVVDKLAKKFRKVKLYSHNTNLGKGAAIRTGINYVRGDYMIVQDADLEYNPEEFAKLTKLARTGNAVYGSRILGNNKHAYTRTYLGNIIITGFCNILFGSKITDSYTCYKLIPVKTAKQLKLNSNGFEVEAEIIGKLLKKKVPVVEIPISYNPRSYEKGKKIKAKDALTGALKLLEVRFG